MAIPRQSVNLSGKEFKAIVKSVCSGQMISGGGIKDFESMFARYIGVKHAVALSSGRAAQYLALRSFHFAAGSEIIVPAYTFYIVPLIVKLSGLKPVFVDAQLDTYNLDPDKIEAKITSKTKAIIATHIAGQPCDLDQILQIAEKHDLRVIEDCAEACGSEYKDKKVGSIGDISYYSFHVSKNMTCLGGGIVATNDDQIFEQIKMLADQYNTASLKSVFKNIIYAFYLYVCTRPAIFTLFVNPLIVLAGFFSPGQIDGIFKENTSYVEKDYPLHSAKMANLQASVGLEQLSRLEAMNLQRIKNARILYDALSKNENLRMQKAISGVKNTYLYFYLQVPNRRELRRRLSLCGIDSKEDGLSLCSKLDGFHEEGNGYPVAERLIKSNIELPNFPTLGEGQMHKIADKVKSILQETNP